MPPNSEIASSSGPCQPSFDGNHLSWQDFRTDVLAPHRIRLIGSSPLNRIPQLMLRKIMTGQEDLARFDAQRQQFRLQVAQDTAFNASPVFPPNCLPPQPAKAILQRCMAPRFGREALPQRSPDLQCAVYELPTPRPTLACGFGSEAFTEAEAAAATTSMTNTGTAVCFETGIVMPGTTVYCPYMVFERPSGEKVEDSLEAATNRCAIGGSSCLRALQMLYSRASDRSEHLESPVTFSCVINNSFAIINYHWIEPGQGYHMSPLCKFDLNDDEHFNKFQVWMEAMETWASAELLPKIKSALNRFVQSENTPPPSPMPSLTSSLTLSVDTKASTEDNLMRALRSAYPKVIWRYNGMTETPINSSIAQCGTPMQAIKLRTLNLSPIQPKYPSMIRSPTDDRFDTPLSPFRAGWAKSSPVGRYFPGSPLRSAYLRPESPCRSSSLSPHEPPPDAPSSPTNPILVLQKRLEVAMAEIQDLKEQMHVMSSELKAISDCSSSDSDAGSFVISNELERRISVIEVKISESANNSRRESPHSVSGRMPERESDVPAVLGVDTLFAALLVSVTILVSMWLNCGTGEIISNLLLLTPLYLDDKQLHFWWQHLTGKVTHREDVWDRDDGSQDFKNSSSTFGERWVNAFRGFVCTQPVDPFEDDCLTPVAVQSQQHGGFSI